MFEFIIAAVTNDHKLGDVKQHTFIILRFRWAEVLNSWVSLGLKSQSHQDCVHA